MTKNLQTLSEFQHLLLNEIYDEFKIGLLALNSLPAHTVTFYGGAKVKTGSETYQTTKNIAKIFAQKNWGIISGGGPGIMAASLEGAKEGGGQAIAFRIKLKDEEPILKNPDVDILFNHFSARKFVLRQSDAFIYSPGGFGTLDELMENLTLMKTGKYPQKPVFLLDSSFWNGYIDWFKKILLEERQVLGEDGLDLFKIVDTAEEIMDYLFN